MKKIIFKDLGCSKWNGSIPIKDDATPEEIAEAAYNASLKHLGSRFPDSVYDADKNEGRIETGWHTAGTYSVQSQ